MLMDQQKNNRAILDQILSGARWSTLLRLTAQIISWLSTIVVVRFITPADYGLNAMLEAPLELMFLFSTLGLDIALVRSKKLVEADLRSAFGWLLIINGVLFLAYFFGSTLIASYFNEPRLEPLAKALAFVFILLPLRVIPNALLNRELKFKLQSSVDLVASVAAAATTLTMAVQGAGIWALVAGVLVSRTLTVILLMILRPWFITPSLSFAAVRGMLAFGSMTTLWAGLVLLSDKLPSLVGGPILNVGVLGIFAVAMQFALLPLSKAMPIINPIIFPAFSKFQDQRLLAGQYLEKLIGVLSLILFPVMVGNACIAHVFVPTVLGNKWVDVVTPLLLLSLVMPFRLITSILRPVMSAMGRVDLSFASALIMLILLFPMIFFGARQGITGLVVAMIFAEPIVMFITIWMCTTVLTTSFKGVAICVIPAIVASGIMASAIATVRLGINLKFGFVSLIFEIAVGAIAYYLTLRILYRGPLDKATSLVMGSRDK